MQKNANRVLSDQYLLPKFLSDNNISIALMNEIHLNPKTKLHMPAYTAYRTEGSRPQYGEQLL